MDCPTISDEFTIHSSGDFRFASSDMASSADLVHNSSDLAMPSENISSSESLFECSSDLALPSDILTSPVDCFDCVDVAVPLDLTEDLSDLIMSSEDITSVVDPIPFPGNLEMPPEDIDSCDVGVLPNVDLHLECIDDSQYEIPEKRDWGSHTLIGQNVQLRITFPDMKLRCNKQDMQPVRFNCPHCKKTFTKEQLLRQHLVSKHGQVLSFNCSQCDFQTQSNRNLLRHIRRRHKRKDFSTELPPSEMLNTGSKKMKSITDKQKEIFKERINCTSQEREAVIGADTCTLEGADTKIQVVGSVISNRIYQNLHLQRGSSSGGKNTFPTVVPMGVCDVTESLNIQNLTSLCPEVNSSSNKTVCSVSAVAYSDSKTCSNDLGQTVSGSFTEESECPLTQISQVKDGNSSASGSKQDKTSHQQLEVHSSAAKSDSKNVGEVTTSEYSQLVQLPLSTSECSIALSKDYNKTSEGCCILCNTCPGCNETSHDCNEMPGSCSETCESCSETSEGCRKTSEGCTCSKTFDGCSKTSQSCDKTSEGCSKTSQSCRKTSPRCDKTFESKSDMKTPLRSSHQKPFVCSWKGCSKSFRDKHNLETHFAVHSGKKSRRCDLCDYSCIQKASMNWHMKTKHPSNTKVSEKNNSADLVTSGPLVRVEDSYAKTIHVELIKMD